jgi:crotonobetainyl-CoA:carnitine CoA-transferase CaiB-like acyl-CoA transferase
VYSASRLSTILVSFGAIERPDMKEDPRFSNHAVRLQNQAELDEAIGAWFATKTREEAIAHMRAAEVAVGPVYDISDITKDVHFREREILVDLEDGDLDAIPTHNFVPRLSATPGAWRRPAPQLGEHTREILSEAGYDSESNDRLMETEGGA